MGIVFFGNGVDYLLYQSASFSKSTSNLFDFSNFNTSLVSLYYIKYTVFQAFKSLARVPASNRMSRRYLYDQIRVCLFKSKYIPGVRVERPGISGLHRAYFDFPFSFSFFLSFLFFSTLGTSTYALSISSRCRSRFLRLFLRRSRFFPRET